MESRITNKCVVHEKERFRIFQLLLELAFRASALKQLQNKLQKTPQLFFLQCSNNDVNLKTTL